MGKKRTRKKKRAPTQQDICTAAYRLACDKARGSSREVYEKIYREAVSGERRIPQKYFKR